MPSHHHTAPTLPRKRNAADDIDTLRFSLRLMLDFHGPAAVINYATDHNIRCEICCTCGWMPHHDGECLMCDLPL
jgi:hypothetical protein